LTFSNLQYAGADSVALDKVFKGGTHAHATKVAVGANTVGCTKSSFTGWTLADAVGELSDF
jgi:hypothetical protein